MNEVEMVHISFKSKYGSTSASADITVPPIGSISIKNALSAETIALVEKEVLSVLNYKLGKTL